MPCMYQFYTKECVLTIVIIFCNSRPSGKREPEITKPEYYMAVAKLSEHRSKDAKTQVH